MGLEGKQTNRVKRVNRPRPLPPLCPVRHGEDPFPDGHPGQHLVDEIRRLLGHAPPAATGADPAALAGQRQEAFERAVVAPDPQEAMDAQPAPEEAAELPLDEVGQPDAVSARGCRGEEGFQMLLHHAVEDRVGGDTREVGSHGARPNGFRAVRHCRAAACEHESARSPGAQHPANGALRSTAPLPSSPPSDGGALAGGA